MHRCILASVSLDQIFKGLNMLFFKYLIFVLFSLISFSLFAATGYKLYGRSDVYPTKEAACASAVSSSEKTEVQESTCWILRASGDGTYYRAASISIFQTNYTPKCPEIGYPINVIQSADSPIEKIRCVPLAGTDQYCVAQKNNYPILNSASGENMISYVMENTSQTPVSSCTPLKEGQCNNKDPYGGCFKIPNDGCTRTQNGSIICPNNHTPEVQNNCTGTYCERPPTGCPKGYVSGSFNGKALCVKSSPSNGSGSDSGDGDGSGSNTNTSTSTSTSTNTSTSSNGSGGSTTVNVTNNNTNNTTVNIDVSGIIGAINTMKTTLSDFLNDINKSVKEVTSTLNGTNQKIDATNQKLDTTNSTLSQINQNGKDTNNKLDQLINKQGGENNGNGTDLTATNQKIDELNKTAKESKGLLQDIKDWFTQPVDTSSMEATLPEKQLTPQSFNLGLYGSSPQCPADRTLSMSLLGRSSFSYTFSFSMLCEKLALFGQLIMIIAYLYSAHIITRNS